MTEIVTRRTTGRSAADAPLHRSTADAPDPRPDASWTALGARPRVSVVAVVRDEEPYLETTLLAAVEQTYGGPLEVVVAVGPSHDRTLEIAHEIAARDPRVRVVDNPTGGRSEGLNLAIEAAERPDVVVRVDGHAVLPVQYVARAVRALQRTGADVVGGMMVPVGRTPFQSAVARAMAHPAGIGAAAFHTGGESGPAPTVYLGVFRADTLARVGGYDPTLVRAEDWDLNRRIRESGGVVWFEPDLQIVYRPRRNVRDLARQFWRTGMWRREVVRRHPATASVRYLAAPTLVLGLAGSAVLGLARLLDLLVPAVSAPWLGIGLLPPSLYAIVVVVASIHAGMSQPAAVRRRLPLVLVVMHVAWGVGFLHGVSARARTEHRT